MIIIKNIIFDLGGVILRDSPIYILDDINLDNYTYNELKRFFDNWIDLDLGKETLEEKFNKCDFSYEIEKKYKDILINCYKYRKINIKIINLLNILKSNNYMLYVLSNNNKETYDYYRNNDLLECIDGWVVSCEYNTLKKDGILFEILLKKYNLNVNECYFIDDKKINIEIAEKYGIKGYFFKENENIDLLYKNMKDNGINLTF